MLELLLKINILFHVKNIFNFLNFNFYTFRISKFYFFIRYQNTSKGFIMSKRHKIMLFF